MKENANTGWDIIIDQSDKTLSIKELLKYRDLIGLLIRRDFVSVYKQTILGPLWFLFQPIMSTIMYMFVFGSIAKLGTDGIPQPLFYFSGNIIWGIFSSILQKSSDIFINNSGIFGKVYFPRFAMPIVYSINSLFTFAIQLILLIIIYLFYVFSSYPFAPNLWLLAIPVLIFQLMILAIGIGITISSLTTKYRDLRNLVVFGLSILMFATPIVYPYSQIPEKWKVFVFLNPVAPIVEIFRYALLGNGYINIFMWIISLCFTTLIFIIGVKTFVHIEKNFIDVI